MWVSPFRYLRIDGYLLLPAAFRSLSRLSSALSAKASTLRSLCLTFVIRGTIVDGGFLMTCVNNLVSGHGCITAIRLLASDMACYQPWYHLRSKRHEQDRRSANAANRLIRIKYISGGDALRGHTRSHPEHDG